MERMRVASSNVKSIGWQETPAEVGGLDVVGVLEVEFLNGSVYEYRNVPKIVYGALVAPGISVGKIFAHLVKSRDYVCTRTQEPRAATAVADV